MIRELARAMSIGFYVITSMWLVVVQMPKHPDDYVGYLMGGTICIGLAIVLLKDYWQNNYAADEMISEEKKEVK